MRKANQRDQAAMRRYAAAMLVLLGVLAALAALVTEFTWRHEHSLVTPGAVFQNGSQVAEVRFMPEGSETPYGSSVFVRSSWAVMQSWQSTLVFSGYCAEIKVQWPSARRLSVSCELLEGLPRLHRPVLDDITVEVTTKAFRRDQPTLTRNSP